MKARDFIEYMKDKIISAAPIIREGDKHSYAWYKGKFDIFKMESGRSSLTEYFKKKNYKLFVINSKGDLYSEANWCDSNTYAINDQKYRMFLDKHTTRFSKFTKKQKKKFQMKIWGPCSHRQRILCGKFRRDCCQNKQPVMNLSQIK
jgi:threonyl-tRNA synthetase